MKVNDFQEKVNDYSKKMNCIQHPVNDFLGKPE
jgi:hypothetical protein